MTSLVARAAAGFVSLLSIGCGSGSSGPSSGRAVSALADGSWLVAGRFERTLAIPGIGDALESHGVRDAFVARYDADTRVAWARNLGFSGADEGWDVAALQDGSALLTGEFEGQVSLAPDGDALVCQSAGKTDAFLARFDARGSLTWLRTAGGVGDDLGRAVDAFPDGSCVVAGRFEGEMYFDRGEATERRIVARGKDDSFVARFAADGRVQWVVCLAGPGSDYAQDIAALPDGSCLVTGSFERSLALGDPAGGVTLASAGGDDVFLCRLGSDGTPLWARSAGGEVDDTARGMDAFVDGTCVVTGRFGAHATFGRGEAGETRLDSRGERDAFVAVFDVTGALRWARAAGGTSSDSGRAAAALADGGTLVTGYFEGAAVFGAGETKETWLESDGALDVFVAHLDRDGHLLQAVRYGLRGTERSNGIALLGERSYVLAAERTLPGSTGDGELLVIPSTELGAASREPVTTD